MNRAIIVVLVLLWGAECRPVRQDVLAGEDFLAFLMRSHRPRPPIHNHHHHQHQQQPQQQQQQQPTTARATTTEALPTETETSATTLFETEPPSIVAVRVSSSVRKEALHENSILPASATRSHFGVEAAGYRESSPAKVEDSVAEASHDFQARENPDDAIEKKPYAEALTFEESGLGYETRVSSETSQSRVYFRRPEPIDETVIVRTSQTRNYQVPIVVADHTRNERKYIPRYHAIPQEAQRPPGDIREYSTQSIVSQTREERRFNPHQVISSSKEQQPLDQPINNQENQEEVFESQKILKPQPLIRDYYRPQQAVVVNEPYATSPPSKVNNDGQYQTPQPVTVTQSQEVQFLSQPQPSPPAETHQPLSQYQPQSPQPIQTTTDAATKVYETQSTTLPSTEGRRYEPRQERHYEQPEQNYEVDEAISVMTNGRIHGVQTERPQDQQNKKVGLVQEENYRKYRVEEKTPDGFIVGEYGVVSHDDGRVRGVRYTADGSINPRLIYDALVKFLSLK